MNIHEINDGLKDLNIKVVKNKRNEYNVWLFEDLYFRVDPEFFESDFNINKMELAYVKDRKKLQKEIESHPDYVKNWDGRTLSDEAFNKMCDLFEAVDLNHRMWRHKEDRTVLKNLGATPYIEKELLILYKDYRKKLNDQAS